MAIHDIMDDYPLFETYTQIVVPVKQRHRIINAASRCAICMHVEIEIVKSNLQLKDTISINEKSDFCVGFVLGNTKYNFGNHI